MTEEQKPVEPERRLLFTKGTDFMVWYTYNCGACANNLNPNSAKKEECCPQEYEVALACINDGMVSQEDFDIVLFNGFSLTSPTCKNFKGNYYGQSNIIRV